MKMFVSDTNIFTPGRIRVKISSLEGANIVLEVEDSCRIDQLKIEAISQVYGSVDAVKLSLYYRLIPVAQNTTHDRFLNEDLRVCQAGIKDNDELILVKKRLSTVTMKKEDASGAPTATDIVEATKGLPARNSEQRVLEPTLTEDFQIELKNILVSLIDVAQKLLSLNPDAIKDAAKYTMSSRTRPLKKEVKNIDPRVLQSLIDMGFDTERATKALLISRMNQQEAVQWLFDNDNEPLSPAPSVTSPSDSDTAGSLSAEASESEDSMTIESRVLKLSKLPTAAKVKRMLESFQAYKRREFKPNQTALQNLVEMGFEEDAAIDALRIRGNIQDEACEWLLSHEEEAASETEVDHGLDVDCSLYKAIMSNHVIQLALSNPRTLLALLQMFENPNTMQTWLNDPDLSPMLLQLSRIYHAEKYGR